MKHILILLAALATLNATENPLATLEAAAASGNATAQFQLGRAYFRGEGVATDKAKAHEWILKSAEQGNPEAVTSMGYFYSQGVILEKDEAKAIEWFRKGAEAGSPKSQMNLGLMLRQGKTITRNHTESMEWLEKAASTGDSDAIRTLGQLYFLGDSLLIPDQAKSLPHLRTAAEAGDPVSQNLLGVAYREGHTGRIDLEKAKEWFRKAAQLGQVKAQSNLAHILGVASPTSPDRKEALIWLIIAKDQGEATSTKTFKEILATIPADLLAHAQKEANIFLNKDREEPAKSTLEE
jgi:TPR repeat protein